MSDRRSCAWIVLAGILSGPLASASNEAYVGEWQLTINAPGVVPYEAKIDIERLGDDIVAFVENGPAPVTIEGNRIILRVDSRDRQGFRFTRVLAGRLEGDRITGTVDIEGLIETAAEFGEDRSPWSAVRASSIPARDSKAFRLEDFEGTWIGVRGRDLRKYTMALTAKGQAWVDAYDARMDEPQKRCVSPGLVAAVTWIFPFELLRSNDGRRLTLLYEAFGLHRRVFMDQQDEPEFYPESSMGYSTGRFDDGELVIETTHLAASTRDFNGEPVSENTRIVERYYLTDDGRQLNLEMVMHDAENYERPPIRRRAWQRNDDALIFPFECDPDSFFRQLYEEGRMQEYIDRAAMRP